LAKMLLPLPLLPDDSTGSDVSVDDGVLMRPNSTALDTAKARRAHPLFLHCQDHPRQHLRDRFLPQDRSSFALFSPGILVVHSLSTHPTSVTNVFHRFNLRYGAACLMALVSAAPSQLVTLASPSRCPIDFPPLRTPARAHHDRGRRPRYSA
jgi:hypothetical protein